jgi:hypothetical protein
MTTADPVGALPNHSLDWALVFFLVEATKLVKGRNDA